MDNKMPSEVCAERDAALAEVARLRNDLSAFAAQLEEAIIENNVVLAEVARLRETVAEFSNAAQQMQTTSLDYMMNSCLPTWERLQKTRAAMDAILDNQAVLAADDKQRA